MSEPQESSASPPSGWRAWEARLARVERSIVVTAMMVMFAAGIAQVGIRLAGWRSVGTDEIVTFSMAILVFVGAGLIVYTADHIAIEVLEYVPNVRLRTILRGFGLVALGVFGAVFGYYALDFFGSVSGEKTLTLGLPLFISAGAMVVGAALILVHAVLAVMRLVAGERAQPNEIVPAVHVQEVRS